MYLQYLAILPAVFLTYLPWLQTSAIIPCLGPGVSSTLEALITCFDGYTVPQDTYRTNDEYIAAQANSDERSEWNAAVASLLTVDGNCTSSVLPAGLSEVYHVSLFAEAGVNGKSFCVLSEINSLDSHYARGWGLMVVPATRSGVSRCIHISAPHPKYDQNTPNQAAAIFKNTGAKSLFIAGRHRDAYSLARSCVNDDYSKTDPAHDVV